MTDEKKDELQENKKDSQGNEENGFQQLKKTAIDLAGDLADFVKKTKQEIKQDSQDKTDEKKDESQGNKKDSQGNEETAPQKLKKIAGDIAGDIADIIDETRQEIKQAPQNKYEAACLLLNDGKEYEAIDCFREAAEAGHADAQYELGCILLKKKPGCGKLALGIVIAIIVVAAFRFFSWGIILAIPCIFLWLSINRRKKLETIEAMEWLQKAAKQGHANAKSKLKKSELDIAKS